jgi:hypothetical protein
VKHTRTNDEARCPACQTRLNMATYPRSGNAVPKPGDVTVCVYCTMVCWFNTDLTVRALTPTELADLPIKKRMQVEDLRRAAMVAGVTAAKLRKAGGA